MTELLAIATWAALYLVRAAHVAFSSQTTKLVPVMQKVRQAMLPFALVVAGFAPLAQAHGMPGAGYSGASAPERVIAAVISRDGISLDEAVSRAERQYRARVVRTEVQDEDGRKVYVLKLLSDDGRVFTVRIDASTGRSR